jgi:hypothetical protein
LTRRKPELRAFRKQAGMIDTDLDLSLPL